MRYVLFFCVVIGAFPLPAQKLTLAFNMGPAIPAGAFLFQDESIGKTDFSSKHKADGTVALGADICYRPNKLLQVSVSPQFQYNGAAMEVAQKNSDFSGTLVTVSFGFKTIVLPVCFGYSVKLFKKLPLTFIYGFSYTSYHLNGFWPNSYVVSGGAFTAGPPGSGVEQNNTFKTKSSLGYVAGLETYPIKSFSKLGFFIRYCAALPKAGDNQRLNTPFTMVFMNGAAQQRFNQNISYAPSNFTIGVAYRFAIVK